jgi:transcriptional regulator with XRE-family HTH domain
MAGMDEGTVGQRLIAARKEMGMKQVEVAELIHVSERTMHAYESDEVVPFRKLRELSDVLGRPMFWILHGDKAEQTSGADLVPLLEKALVELKAISKALAEDGDLRAKKTAPKKSTTKKKPRAKQ